MWFFILKYLQLTVIETNYIHGDLHQFTLDLKYDASNFFDWLYYQGTQFNIELEQVLKN